MRSTHSASSMRPSASGASFMDASALPTMAESPVRSSARTLHITPQHGAATDWEGVQSWQEQQRYAAAVQDGWRGGPGGAGLDTSAQRSGARSRLTTDATPPSPSVSVLRPAADGARESMRRLLDSHGAVHDTPQHLLDHQAFLEWRREEYKKRLEAEARGQNYVERRPYSESFVQTLPGGGNNLIQMDFVNRSRQLFSQPQVLGSKEELAWLQPPQIPPPVGWNGYWDLCPGHELVLQLMAVSGANAENSPSLTQHFMYPEFLSCIQRLQYGAYLIHYTKAEPPHERYFYVKPLPLGNRGQFCPFLCWSTHRHSHQALDAVPLCNVAWVTQGICSKALEKYYLGGDYIAGPYVGKARAELLKHGTFTIWLYYGNETRSVDACATDPLVFAMFMKLLEDVAQLNAALDVSGSVRAFQLDLERLREEGMLIERESKPKSSASLVLS